MSLKTIASVILSSKILITRMSYYVTSDQSHNAVFVYKQVSLVILIC